MSERTSRHPAPARLPAGARPLVALVGRPNVGKSTLFNRLLGRREAIVEAEPGTTRDRNYADIDWDGLAITLVDTGGIMDAGQGMDARVREQAQLAIEEADAILFLVDAFSGITPGDQDVADLLRRSGKPVLLVANKADNPARERNAPEFYSLGLGDPFPVSAHHGTGLAELQRELEQVLPPWAPATTGEVGPGVRIAVVGRPNVGKSALINAILGEERALVSPVPGTTRDALDTPFTYRDRQMMLIDTAGIRRAGRIDAGIERYSVMRSLKAIARADVAVLVLDAAAGLAAQDAHIAGYVKEAYRGLVVAVNKWDLSGIVGVKREDVLPVVESRLRFFPGVPIIFTSAKLGQGVERLLDAVISVQQARELRVPTAAVNQVVRQALESHPPPTVHGRQLKVLYVTQASESPPTFVFFVNDPELLHFSYQRFLENRLREAFGFSGVAIRLVFRSREERS